MRYFLIALLLLPTVYASIGITSEIKSEYNLGEEIPVEIDIIPNDDAEALLKSTIKCDNELTYYTSPISLTQGKTKSVKIPPIKTAQDGVCAIRLNLVAIDGENIEGYTTPNFYVSNDLILAAELQPQVIEPGDKILIEGTASGKSDKIQDGVLTFIGQGITEETKLRGTSFKEEITVPKNIKSGDQELNVEIKDPNGNFAEQVLSFTVSAIPTKVAIEHRVLHPPTDISIIPYLTDQAEDEIQQAVKIMLVKEKFGKDEILFDETLPAHSDQLINIREFDSGEYLLKIEYNDLKAQEAVIIPDHSDIEVSFGKETATFKNTGNVRFKDTYELNLISDEGTEVFKTKLNLDVGEEKSVQLSKYVKGGEYEPAGFNATLTFDDKRSFFTKLSQTPFFLVLIIFLVAIGSGYYILRKK